MRRKLKARKRRRHVHLLRMTRRKRALRSRPRAQIEKGQAPMLPRAYQRADTRKTKNGRRGAKARALMKRVLLARYGIK